jgi:hypothetical protein
VNGLTFRQENKKEDIPSIKQFISSASSTPRAFQANIPGLNKCLNPSLPEAL